MGMPVVSVASGGLPVVDVGGSLRGTPVTEVANGRGVPVTKVAALGLPVVYETIGVGPSGDPSWTSVKLLMGFNGTNGAIGGPGFTDESSAAHGVASQAGNPAISTAQSVFGGSSMKFSGFERVYYADHADWNLANAPFTIECRLQHNTAGLVYVIGQWDASPNNGWIIYLNTAVLTFNLSTTGSDNIIQITGPALTTNTWYAVALDFDGTKYRLYVNGAMVASSVTLRTIFNSPLNLAMGSSSSGANYLVGYIDELRITKGVARYASDAGYTVAATAFPRM
jgi:hypothetical protein